MYKLASEDRHVVKLLHTVPPKQRGRTAKLIAERLRVDSGRIAQLLGRDPGFITKPISLRGAERILGVFSAFGVAVEIVPLDDQVDPKLLNSFTDLRIPQEVSERLWGYESNIQIVDLEEDLAPIAVFRPDSGRSRGRADPAPRSRRRKRGRSRRTS